MARRKKKEAEDHWARYFAIQLTPEQKAAARAELEKRVEKARADGVYERLAERFGKVKWSVSYEEMADKDRQG